MDTFYTVVVIVAVVFLIVCLIIIGIMMQYQKGSDVFPPTANICPDKWTVNGSGCSPNEINGNTIVSAAWCTANNTICAMDSTNKFTFLDSATICDKQKFAKENNILWDGVSNYNKCV
jgi:hypothetical protein